MPQQKITDWEPVIDDWEPINDWEPVEEEQFQPSLLEQYNQSWINQPLSHKLTGGPAGKRVAELLDPSELDPTKQARIPDWIPFVGGGTYRSLVGGLGEGATGVAEGFTTPLNLATMGAFTGAGTLATAAPKAAQALNTAGRVLSAPVAFTGTQKVLNPELSTSERLFGLAEAAGGITGMAQKMPKIQPGAGRQPLPEGPNVTRTIPTSSGRTIVTAPENVINQTYGGAIPEFEPTVTLQSPTPAKVADLRNKGYVSAGVDKNGFPQMVHKDFLAKVEKSTQPSLFGENEIVFDEEIKIKNPSASTIKRLKDEGYELVHVDEHGNEAIFRPIQEEEMRVGPDQEISNEFLPDYPYQEYAGPERRLENRGPGQGLPERRAQDEGFLRPSDRLIPNERQNELLDILGGKQKGIQMTEDWMPQEMKVKGVREGQGGLENVAVGGADPRVLDVLGSSLYTKPRPVVTMKELLQNAIDEHRISGSKSPIRVLVRDNVQSPLTGEPTNAITVRDRGRGLTPEEIYTVFTDVGKTGKAGIESASGGFGFAKAAPFLGGKYVEVSSIVLNEAGQKVKYSFQGDPAMLKNQARGVPLNREVVDPKTPTGLEVTTHFPKDTGTYSAEEMAKNMAELAKKGGPEVWVASSSSLQNMGPESTARWFLDNVSDDIDEASKLLYVKRHVGKGLPKIQGQIETPGAKIDLRYETPKPGQEAAGYDIHYMNKGLYQQSGYGAYGSEPVPNVPRSIVADISAIVEEGTEGYPFGANREQVDRTVNQAIEQWIDQNIKSGAQRKRVAAIQEKYDSIKTLPNGRTLYYDKGSKFTPDEIQLITEHPEFVRGMEAIEIANKELLGIADTLGWTSSNLPDWVPSKRLKKFGVLFQGAESSGTTLGIHIPRPDDLNDSAILINVFELLNHALKQPKPLDHFATGLYTTITHELAHIPGGGHDTNFAYRHAQLLEQMGKQNTIHILENLQGAFDDGSGNISPDVSDLLSIYNESRGRRTSKDDTLLSTGVSSVRPPNSSIRERGNVKGTRAGEIEPSPLREAYNFSRGMLASWDLSAPLRQGMGLAFTKEWREAIMPMLRSLGPESAYKEVVRSIEQKPLFQRRVNTQTGKILPSYAESVGLKITDLRKSLSNREEATMSNWAEKYVPGVGRSNRAYNAFLNKLRADTFEKLMNQARDIAGEEPGLNPYRNEMLAREIAEYVMTATGRGPLKIATPTLVRDAATGKYRPAMKERSFEQAADILTDAFFSPKLITSRIRMLNPGTYVMASPFVRQQYLKSALTTLAAWGGISGLAALAGAEVSTDLNSADFGKIKVGDTRIDPGAGFQQYLVAFNRLLSGKTTSSATGEEQILGEGFQAETGKDIGERFVANKLHPVLKFAYDLWDASEYKPFNVADRLMQMFVPLIVQDVYELATKSPELLPAIVPIGLGMGAQTYEAGETEGKMIPPEYDYQVTSSPTKPMYDWFTGQ